VEEKEIREKTVPYERVEEGDKEQIREKNKEGEKGTCLGRTPAKKRRGRNRKRKRKKCVRFANRFQTAGRWAEGGADDGALGFVCVGTPNGLEGTMPLAGTNSKTGQ